MPERDGSQSSIEWDDDRSPQLLLDVNNIEVVYDRIILVLKGISLRVPAGSIVTLLGANGAGKTTTLMSISNLLSLERGTITNGVIRYQGEEIQRRNPESLVKRGIVQVLEGRRCFPHLTVEENLLVGAFTQGQSRRKIGDEIETVYQFFPLLKERRKSLAGYISGGEQQMLAIGRALLARPKLLLLDEPSMGLAPLIVSEIFEILKQLNRELQLTVLLAEQNANIALRYSSYGYVLENGQVVMENDAKSLLENADIKQFYLGLGGEDRGSLVNRKRPSRPNVWMM